MPLSAKLSAEELQEPDQRPALQAESGELEREVKGLKLSLGGVDIHRTSTMSAASQMNPAKFSTVFS